MNQQHIEHDYCIKSKQNQSILLSDNTTDETKFLKIIAIITQIWHRANCYSILHESATHSTDYYTKYMYGQNQPILLQAITINIQNL